MESYGASGVGVGGREAYSQLFLKGSFLEYLPKNAVVLLDGGVSLENAYTELMEQAEEVRASRVEKEELPPTVPPAYPEWGEISNRWKGPAA